MPPRKVLPFCNGGRGQQAQQASGIFNDPHINRTFKNADKDLKKLASLCICFGFSLDLLLNESGWVLFGIVKDQKENLSEMEKLSDECLKLKA